MRALGIFLVALLWSPYRGAHAVSVNPAFVISSDRTTGRFCAGSLIHPDIVLTAATCRGAFAEGVFVGASNLDGSDGQYHEVELEAIHPKHVEGKADNNVMLLKLKSASDSVLQEINAESELPIDGAEIEVLGFSKASAESIYPFEQTNVVATKVDHATCAAKYVGYDIYVIDSHVFCSSALGAACHGNMGSPLVDSRGNQVGMVAGGGGCNSNNYPVLNVRTSNYGKFMYQGVCALSSEPFGSCPARPPTAPTGTPSASFESSATPSSSHNLTTWGMASPTTVPTRDIHMNGARGTAQPSLRGHQQDSPIEFGQENLTETKENANLTGTPADGYLTKLMSDMQEVRNTTVGDSHHMTPIASPEIDAKQNPYDTTQSPSLAPATRNGAEPMEYAFITAEEPAALPSLYIAPRDTPAAARQGNLTEARSEAHTTSAPSSEGNNATLVSDMQEVRNTTVGDSPGMSQSETAEDMLSKFMAAATPSPSLSPISQNDIESTEYTNETSLDAETSINATETTASTNDTASDPALALVADTETTLNLTSYTYDEPETNIAQGNVTNSVLNHAGHGDSSSQNSTAQVSPSDLIDTVYNDAVAFDSIESEMSDGKLGQLAEQGNMSDISNMLGRVKVTLGDPADTIMINSTLSASNESSDESSQFVSVEFEEEGEDTFNTSSLDSVQANVNAPLTENNRNGSSDKNRTANQPYSGGEVISWDDDNVYTTSPTVTPSPSTAETIRPSANEIVLPSVNETMQPSANETTQSSANETMQPSANETTQSSANETTQSSEIDTLVSSAPVDAHSSKPSTSPDNSSSPPDSSGEISGTNVTGTDDTSERLGPIFNKTSTPAAYVSPSSSPTALRGGTQTAAPSYEVSQTSNVKESGSASSLISDLLQHAKEKAVNETTSPEMTNPEERSPSLSPSSSTANETSAPSLVATGGFASTDETLVPTVAPTGIDVSNSTDPTSVPEVLSYMWNNLKTKYQQECHVLDDCDFQGFTGSTYHAIAFGQCLEVCGLGKKAQVLGWHCGKCPIVEEGTL